VRVALLHQHVPKDAPIDERDTLLQAEAIHAALRELEHDVVLLDCDLDLATLRRRLEAIAPEVVFNLVESMAGTGALVHLVPALLDTMALPYTGAPSDGLMLSSSKTLSKRLLRDARLPTPPLWPDGAGPWIVKSVWEHGSFAIDQGSIAGGDEVAKLLGERRRRHGGRWLAEQYVEGRELNIGLLSKKGGVEVLPAMEIRFDGYAPGQARILGWDAKWEAGTAAYDGTVRQPVLDPADAPLCERLNELGRRSFAAFALSGYARVDFRIDAAGEPWILEVNANPCLSPDGGFSNMLASAGITLSQAVDRIVAAAFENAP
jgi:D-alanine-D-alanine ligase